MEIKLKVKGGKRRSGTGPLLVFALVVVLAALLVVTLAVSRGG